MVNKKKKYQKGGKILGSGRDGAVADPPLLCSKQMNAINKVSKMINITNISQNQYNDYINEYKFGQIFRNIDPNNEFFLPGIDMCTFKDTDKGIPTQIKKDIKTAGYKVKGKPTHILNIVMKKGQDFLDITSKLSKENIFKSLAYLLEGAKHMIYNLNVCHFDVKYPNLLYSKDNNDDKIYPVYIDFSADFVIRDLKSFNNFLDGFGSATSYWIWPLEINALYYHLYYNMLSKHKRKKLLDGLMNDHDIDLNNKNDKLLFDNIIKYSKKALKNKHDLLGLYNKIMVYEIGTAFMDSLKKSQLRNDKDIINILSSMMNIDVIYRPYISDVDDMLKKYISYTVRNDLFIDLKKEKSKKDIQKKVNKSNKVKNIIKKSINTPPLPSGLILSRITPLSQQSFKSKPHKSIINVPPGLKKIKKKSSKKQSKNVKTNCMKMTVKQIKKTKEYKNLPKSANKSKLKKSELCKILQGKDKKTLNDYSKLSKKQLLDIIKNKKNCK